MLTVAGERAGAEEVARNLPSIGAASASDLTFSQFVQTEEEFRRFIAYA